ncbi:hypothetical protein YC2023_064077 [Brassica napus]
MDKYLYAKQNIRKRGARKTKEKLSIREFSHTKSYAIIVTTRSPGVRPGLSKGRYGHTTLRVPLLVPRDERITFFENTVTPTSIYFYLQSCAQGKMEMEGVSNKLLSEVALDQPARMTLYTTLCGN